MSTTHTARANSHRGLLAGLVALVVFASGAVAMTEKGASAGTGAATTPQSAAVVAVPAGAGIDGPSPGRGDDRRPTAFLRDGRPGGGR